MGRMHSLPKGVTRWGCGLLPNYFERLLLLLFIIIIIIKKPISLTKQNSNREYSMTATKIHTCVESLLDPSKLHDDTELQQRTDLCYVTAISIKISS